MDIERRIGDYELMGEQPVGKGGHGIVWKARTLADKPPFICKGETVALKLLLSGWLQNDHVRKLCHKNIVRYMDSFVDVHHDSLCLVMEFLEGETLCDLLEKHPKGLPWSLARSIFSETLEALAYAQSLAITHRDVKPSNIFITADGHVKLIDFEIARDEKNPKTRSSSIGLRGTPDYMMPEFHPDFRKEETFRGDEQSDVFSFGVCFWEALTGRLPYPTSEDDPLGAYYKRWKNGENPTGSLECKKTGLAALNDAGRAFVMKCLKKNRQERYASFTEMLTDFSAIQNRVIEGKTDSYELVSFLGHGGFGQVFEGKRLRDNCAVAVKEYFPQKGEYHQHVRRFRKEGDVLENYPHQHLVGCVEFVEIKDAVRSSFFLVMEFLPETPEYTLAGRIRKAQGKGLNVDEMRRLFSCYLNALQHLHENGFIHRDIKPDNLYAPAGMPENGKLLDLGIVRNLKETLTVGSVPGALEYMAPELILSCGRERGDERSDIYSMGVSFYQALTGRLPFGSLPTDPDKALSQFIAHAQGEGEGVIQYKIAPFVKYRLLADVVSKALELPPQQRYATAAEMRQAIEDGQLSDETNGDEPPGPTKETQEWNPTWKQRIQIFLLERWRLKLFKKKERWNRRRIAAALGGIAAVLAVLGLVLFYVPIRGARLRILQEKMKQTVKEMKVVKPRATYLAELSRHINEAKKWAKKDVRSAGQWRAWGDSLAGYAREAPSVFSNRFTEAVDQDNHKEAQTVWDEWEKSKDACSALGLSMESHVSLERYMRGGLQGLVMLRNLTETREKIPHSITSRNLGKINQAVGDYRKASHQDMSGIGDIERGRAETRLAEISNALVGTGEKYVELLRGQALVQYLSGEADEGDKTYKSLTQVSNDAIDLCAMIECFYTNAVQDVLNAQKKGANIVAEDIKEIRRLAKKANETPMLIKDNLPILAAYADLVAKNKDMLEKEWQGACYACKKSLANIAEQQEPAVERSERLQMLDDTLKLKEAGTVLGDVEDLRARLSYEKNLFLVHVRNLSGTNVTILGEGLGQEDTPMNDGTEKKLTLRVLQEKKLTLVCRGPQGYREKRFDVDVVRGGGQLITISAFETQKLEVSLDMPIADDPPVRVEYRSVGAEQWTEWKDIGKDMSWEPGAYEVRFKRPDYVSMETNMEARSGQEKLIIQGPLGWTPSPELQDMGHIENIWRKKTKDNKDWKTLEAIFSTRSNAEFAWPEHSNRWARVRSEWNRSRPLLAAEQLDKAEEAVAEYLKWLYQVADPEVTGIAAMRRAAQTAPPISLTLPNAGDVEGRHVAQLERLKRWESAAGSLQVRETSDVARKELAAALTNCAKRAGAAGHIDLAVQCEYESVMLLNPASIPDEYDSSGQSDARNMSRICYWRAHAHYYPETSSLEIMNDLLSGVNAAGVMNEYDLQLILYQAYYNWMNSGSGEGKYIDSMNLSLTPVLRDATEDIAEKIIRFLGKRAERIEKGKSNPSLCLIRVLTRLAGLRPDSPLKRKPQQWIDEHEDIVKRMKEMESLGVSPGQDWSVLKTILKIPE